MPTYLITFHTFGTHLHGHADGSVDRENNKPDTPQLPPHSARAAWERGRMGGDPVYLNGRMRSTVESTIRQVCSHRGWILHALQARTTHVHAVVTAEHQPERVMNDLKAWCTRRLAEGGLVERGAKVWARHGSTRWLSSENSFRRACEYTMNEQGAPLPDR